MRRFETEPVGDDPDVANAESLRAIAYDVERIAELLQELVDDAGEEYP